MASHGSETEKERFISDYELAIKQSREVTSAEVQDLIVDLIDDPELEVPDPEIESVVFFLRNALANNDIPLTWLTESFDEDVLSKHSDEIAFRKLKKNGQLEWHCPREIPLSDEGIELLSRFILIDVAERFNICSIAEMRSVLVEFFLRDGEYYVDVEIYLMSGKRLCDEFPVFALKERLKLK